MFLLQNYYFDFLLQNFNLKYSPWIGSFIGKIIIFVRGSEILMAQKCHKMLVVLIYLDIQT